MVSDDLSQVLDDATYDNDATRDPTLAGQVLTWKLAIPSGAIIAFTFTVTITDPDLGDGKLINALTTPAGGNCVSRFERPELRRQRGRVAVVHDHADGLDRGHASGRGRHIHDRRAQHRHR